MLEMRIEVSNDGETWAEAHPMTNSLAFRYQRDRAPDGFHWCSVHRPGQPVEWVLMPDVDEPW